MGEHKKYGGKSHVHIDEKKESKRKPTTQDDVWWCEECVNFTDYDYEYRCNTCGGRMIHR